MSYTDEQLKWALAKMLPQKINCRAVKDDSKLYCFLYWKNKNQHPLQSEVRDTELLHLCWLMEKKLSPLERRDCCEILESLIFPTWQQHVTALAKVKEIEI